MGRGKVVSVNISEAKVLAVGPGEKALFDDIAIDVNYACVTHGKRWHAGGRLKISDIST
ncbi:MAG: hypothetical protein RDV48_23680 [Candidatus Eremiobacteraeota bacterium]|nr:hypothetical protein [Candidatus Eremiobacteraeota bacterium]